MIVPAPVDLVLGLLAPVDILLDVPADRKRSAFDSIAGLLAERVGATRGAVLRALKWRERLGPTHVGDGIAVPHARLDGISNPAVALLRLTQPLPYGTIDDAAVDLLVGVLWPDSDAAEFIPALATITRLLRSPGLACGLRQARSVAEVRAVIAATGEPMQ